MKSDALPAGFPASPEAWEKLITDAPGDVQDPECPYDPNDPAAVDAYWSNAVVVREGGSPAVHAALERRRTRGQRGPQKRPTKVSVTIRYSPEVVAYFKATGDGWQTRMDTVLREYVAEHRS
jgi:uncharacterized protein (DUF4415 family)